MTRPERRRQVSPWDDRFHLADRTGAPDPNWFAEATTCAAGNAVSFATGTSDEHEALQHVAGTWLLWHWSDLDGAASSACPVNQATARVWLLRNDHFGALAEIDRDLGATERGGRAQG